MLTRKQYELLRFINERLKEAVRALHARFVEQNRPLVP